MTRVDVSWVSVAKILTVIVLICGVFVSHGMLIQSVRNLEARVSELVAVTAEQQRVIAGFYRDQWPVVVANGERIQALEYRVSQLEKDVRK